MEDFEKFSAPNCNCQVRKNNALFFISLRILVQKLDPTYWETSQINSLSMCFLKEMFVKKINESQ